MGKEDKEKPLLDGKIDKIIELITEGKTYKEIAAKFKVSLTTLHNYIHNDEFTARTREALQYSASTYADQAESVLKGIKKGSNAIEMAQARELAQHYRWKAGKRAPKKYGDRVQQDVTIDDKTISPEEREARIAALNKKAKDDK